MTFPAQFPEPPPRRVPPPPPPDLSHLPPPPTGDRLARRPARADSIAGLGGLLTFLFLGWIVLGLTGIGLVVWERELLGGDFVEWFDNSEQFQDLDDAWTLHGYFVLAASIATVVVFVIWFGVAYSNLPALSGRPTAHGAGWAFGAWFVPLFNVVRPYQDAQEIWRTSRGEPSGRSSMMVRAWWFALILLTLVIMVPDDEIDPTLVDPDAIHAEALDLNSWAGVRYGGAAVVAVLALVVVRTITRMQETARVTTSGAAPAA